MADCCELLFGGGEKVHHLSGQRRGWSCASPSLAVPGAGSLGGGRNEIELLWLNEDDCPKVWGRGAGWVVFDCWTEFLSIVLRVKKDCDGDKSTAG